MEVNYVMRTSSRGSPGPEVSVQSNLIFIRQGREFASRIDWLKNTYRTYLTREMGNSYSRNVTEAR